MFLNLKHTTLTVYKVSRELVIEVYRTSKNWPSEEKFGMQSQLRRAVNSVKFNIAEGSSKKSKADRCRFYEIARGSIVELDSVYESAVDPGYNNIDELNKINVLINRCFALLTNLISGTKGNGPDS